MYSQTTVVNSNKVTAKMVVEWIAAAAGIFLLVIGLILISYIGFKTVGRAQHRADAANRVKVSSIEIRNQEQRIQVAKQKAEIRLQDAIGVREAQDEIAKTLTPLYVQFEMVDAMKQIATSGKNNTVVYIPAGANGIPLVATTDAQQVGVPEEGN